MTTRQKTPKKLGNQAQQRVEGHREALSEAERNLTRTLAYWWLSEGDGGYTKDNAYYTTFVRIQEMRQVLLDMEDSLMASQRAGVKR